MVTDASMAQRDVHVFMAETGSLLVDLSRKAATRFPSADGEAGPASAPARRRSSRWCSCKGSAARRVRGGEKARVRGGRRASPAPLFVRGRGNCAGYHAARIAYFAKFLWLSCGHASTRVCRAQEGHRISCAARAQDLRRQRGSGWERSLPSGSGQDIRV